jgi:hypothetical protein
LLENYGGLRPAHSIFRGAMSGGGQAGVDALFGEVQAVADQSETLTID